MLASNLLVISDLQFPRILTEKALVENTPTGKSHADNGFTPLMSATKKLWGETEAPPSVQRELRCRQKTWPVHPLLPNGAYEFGRGAEMREERQTTVQHERSGQRLRVAGLQEAEVMGVWGDAVGTGFPGNGDLSGTMKDKQSRQNSEKSQGHKEIGPLSGLSGGISGPVSSVSVSLQRAPSLTHLFRQGCQAHGDHRRYGMGKEMKKSAFQGIVLPTKAIPG